MKDIMLEELRKDGFPNLSLFLEDKALEEMMVLLEELLEERKKQIDGFLKKKNEELQFDDLIQESLLSYLWKILNHLDQVENNLKLRDIISEFRLKIEDFYNELAYSKEYYNKVLWIQNNLTLDNDQKRILELEIKSYKQRGIDLAEEKQLRVKELNKEMSQVGEKFQHNVVDEQSEFIYYFEDDSTLKEMPSILLEKAKSLGKDGGYGIDAEPSLLFAVEKYCSDSEIRKYFYEKRQQWATKGKYDNRENVLKILRLSAEKAQILGYKNAGAMYMCDTMAKEPETAEEFIKKMSEKAKIKAQKEMNELKQAFNLEELKPSDVSYYVRKYKQEHYSIDEEELREYFEFEYVLSWLHGFVKDFFGIELRPIEFDSKTQEKWYEVYKDGKLISYYSLDAFYRKGKRPGAWADYLRVKYKGKLPIVFNVCNFQKIENGETLLYRGDVETLFHEFGHAVHAMLAESQYADLSGFNVEWDFVELPSQLLENWVDERESLVKLAKHYKTGETLSEEVLDKLDELKYFMQGYFVLRQNELALVDIHLYTNPVPKNVEELDKEIIDVVNKNSIFKRGEEYKMYCAFLHIFGGEYECKYYSYMWAEQLGADVFSRIKERGMFNSEIGKEYRDKILAQGTRKPAKELFHDFMGRDVSEEALLRKYGLI